MKIKKKGGIPLEWTFYAGVVGLVGTLAGLGFLAVRGTRFKRTARALKKAERLSQQEIARIPRSTRVEPVIPNDREAA